MAYQQNDNSGSLFVNTRKQTQKQPDFEGNVLINGIQKRVAGWNKVSASGKQYISLAFSDPQPPQQQGYAPQGDAPQQPQFQPGAFQQTGQFPQQPVNQQGFQRPMMPQAAPQFPQQQFTPQQPVNQFQPQVAAPQPQMAQPAQFTPQTQVAAPQQRFTPQTQVAPQAGAQAPLVPQAPVDDLPF